MRIKKIILLIGVSLLTALFGFFSTLMLWIGEDVTEVGRYVFLVPTVIFALITIGVLLDKNIAK